MRLLLLLLLAVAGCTHAPIAPSPVDRARIERVTVVPARFAPHSNYEAFARGLTEEIARGAAQGAMLFGLEWIKWVKEPVTMFLLAPFVTAVGAVVGAATGPSKTVPEATLRNIEATQESALKSLRIQERLGEKLLASHVDYKLVKTERDIGPTHAADQLTYAALRASTDAALEAGITEIGFVGGGGRNPRVSLALKASARMVRITDGSELAASVFQFGSVARPFSEWAADDGALLRESLDAGITTLAENIVDRYLRAYPVRLRSGGWDVLGGPNPIAPRPGTFSAARADSPRPTLRWEPLAGTGSWARTDPAGALARAQDLRYDVRVWRIDGELVTERVYEKRGLTEPRHTLDSALAPRSQYLWSVRGVFRTDGREYTTTWSACGEMQGELGKVPGCAFSTP